MKSTLKTYLLPHIRQHHLRRAFLQNTIFPHPPSLYFIHHSPLKTTENIAETGIPSPKTYLHGTRGFPSYYYFHYKLTASISRYSPTTPRRYSPTTPHRSCWPYIILRLRLKCQQIFSTAQQSSNPPPCHKISVPCTTPLSNRLLLPLLPIYADVFFFFCGETKEPHHPNAWQFVAFHFPATACASALSSSVNKHKQSL